MLRKNGIELKGKTVVISGAGNVAILTPQKGHGVGRKVVTSPIPPAGCTIRTALILLLSRKSRKSNVTVSPLTKHTVPIRNIHEAGAYGALSAT